MRNHEVNFLKVRTGSEDNEAIPQTAASSYTHYTTSYQGSVCAGVCASQAL